MNKVETSVTNPISSGVSESSICLQSIKQIETSLKNEKSFEKMAARQSLEEAFGQLTALKPETIIEKTVTTQLAVSILGRYGIRVYPTFEEAIPYLIASLQLQLQQLQALPEEDFQTFAKLSDINERKPAFATFVDLIKTTPKENYPNLVEKLTYEQKLQFSETLLYLGYSYSNLGRDALNLTSEKMYFNVLSNLYAGVKAILESVEQTEEVRKQLGELQYNIFPGLCLHECKLNKVDDPDTISQEAFNKIKNSKEDLNESFEILEQAKKYNPSKAMEARIFNLEACRVRDILEDLNEAKRLVSESLKIWDDILKDEKPYSAADLEFYKGLQANAKNNYLALLLTTDANVQEMEPYAEFSREFYEKHGINHPYSMIHLLNLASLEIKKENKEKALLYLNEVQTVSQKYQKWPDTQKYLTKALEIKKSLGE